MGIWKFINCICLSRVNACGGEKCVLIASSVGIRMFQGKVGPMKHESSSRHRQRSSCNHLVEGEIFQKLEEMFYTQGKKKGA